MLPSKENTQRGSQITAFTAKSPSRHGLATGSQTSSVICLFCAHSSGFQGWVFGFWGFFCRIPWYIRIHLLYELRPSTLRKIHVNHICNGKSPQQKHMGKKQAVILTGCLEHSCQFYLLFVHLLIKRHQRFWKKLMEEKASPVRSLPFLCICKKPTNWLTNWTTPQPSLPAPGVSWKCVMMVTGLANCGLQP